MIAAGWSRRANLFLLAAAAGAMLALAIWLILPFLGFGIANVADQLPVVGAPTRCALAYETVAVLRTTSQQGTNLQPITTFVRCAAFHYPFHSGLVVSAMSYLFGQWLHRTPPG